MAPHILCEAPRKSPREKQMPVDRRVARQVLGHAVWLAVSALVVGG